MHPSAELPSWLVNEVVDRALTDAPVALGVLNLELRHVVVNHALGRLYGVDPASAIGSTPAQLLGQLGEHIANRCKVVASGGRPVVGQVVTGVVSATTQTEVHWQIDCLPLMVVDATPGALLLIVDDITTRTRAMRSLNEQRRALAYQASHDPLTALANRFQLLEVLQFHLEGQSRPTVFLVDLDGFKAINDVHGHAAGDHVLAAIADRLRTAVRQEDLVARYGGDEFVLVVRGEVDAPAFIDRLSTLIVQPIDWAGTRVHVGASIGAAVAQDDDTVSSLLKRADDAMYDVKEGRRDARD